MRLTKKDRIKKYGEVFTPDWLVKMMTSEPGVKKNIADFEKRVLEPSAGDGAFLVQIVRQRLDSISKKDRDKKQWIEDCLIGLSNIYGVELQEDNALKARSRMLEVVAEEYEKQFKEKLSKDSDLYKSASYIIDMNIMIGNFLTHKDKDDKYFLIHDWKMLSEEVMEISCTEFDKLFGDPDEMINFKIVGYADIEKVWVARSWE